MPDLPHPAESRRLVSRRSLLRSALLLTGGTALLTACVPPQPIPPDRATDQQDRPDVQAAPAPRPAEVERPAAPAARPAGQSGPVIPSVPASQTAMGKTSSVLSPGGTLIVAR